MIWHCAEFEFDTRMPTVMGILNVTPDSFSDGGDHADFAVAVERALAMVKEGARIIDVGGESTRPGSAEVSIDEELARTVRVVSELAAHGVCVSIDTRHAAVARACVEAGASIINDVSGFRDPAMVEVARGCSAGLVVMHMQGEPKTMQDNPVYDDVVEDVKRYLRDRAAELEAQGIAHERICIDPGPGFGKTPKQTNELLLNMHQFARLGYPLMVAVSRKSHIGALYGIENPKDRDEVSAKQALEAVELGASVVRTHNVALTCEALKDLRPYCFLGLGSNVALVGEAGEEREAKIAVLNEVIGNLAVLPDSQLIDVSSFYESEPAYFEDQDPFVNAVALIRTGIGPHDLLAYAHAIENRFGRTRTVKNGPRTCDVDILDYQCYRCDDERLTLPHPLLTERDFVVKPLLELRPGHVLANGTAVSEQTVEVGHAVKLDQHF
ncbi:dihydropteroate synthase [Raoultibacter phocaeensis]|uniref:dihydropteroate synthase n=1 Tax=Raoultibacter phocaeensis TaxID=2479841 RepID=UPI00111A5DF0|nr:dihydropteroate synthase [Raoultibacter phocaeensis]